MSFEVNQLKFEDNIIREYNEADFSVGDTVHERRAGNFVRKETYIPLSKTVVKKKFIIYYNDSDEEEIRKAIKKEVENLAAVSECEHIVKFYGVHELINEGKNIEVTIIMESMDFSLYDFYKKVHARKKFFSEEILQIIISVLIDALVFCSEKKIMHRNVNPTNVLMNSTGEIKLCDLGASKRIDGSMFKTCIGPFIYWAPEHFTRAEGNDNTGYDIRVDVWSLGITLLELAYGQNPYKTPGELVVDWSSRNVTRDYVFRTSKDKLIQKILGEGYSTYIVLFAGSCLESYNRRADLSALKEREFYMANASNKKRVVADFNHLIDSPLYMG